jgi:membrane associated rhomboid family serine protease
MSEPAAGLVEVGTYPTRRAGLERCLVVLAMGLPCWLVPDTDGLRLLVDAAEADDVREQLRRFERENVAWPPAYGLAGYFGGSSAARSRRIPLPKLFLVPLLWALAVTGVFYLQNRWPGRLERWGVLDGRAVFSRHLQLWRPATALFLHADASHLLSNLIPGLFAFAAVLSAFGLARGTVLLAIAAFLGNLAVGALHAVAGDTSLGASTGIFAAIGLLAGKAIRLAAAEGGRGRWRLIFPPFAAGLTLLGLYGAGGVETDVAAHATGFAAGCLIGLYVTPAPHASPA